MPVRVFGKSLLKSLSSVKILPHLPRSVRQSISCLAIALLVVSLTSCGQLNEPFRQLGKFEVDNVGDIMIKELESQTRQISRMLYEINPDELQKSSVSLPERLQQIVVHPLSIGYQELANKQGVDAIKLALNPAFPNDRVFALMTGISGMTKLAFNSRRELFVPDILDPQKLYNAARNLELINRNLHKQVAGKTLLNLGSKQNTKSFGWRLAQVVSTLDLASKIVDNRGIRTLRTTAQAITTTLLPI